MRRNSKPTNLVVHFTNPDTLTPAEREEFRERLHRVYKILFKEVREQLEEDKKKGIKHDPPTKKGKVAHINELAEKLDIKIPKSVYRLPWLDIWSIEWELQCEIDNRELEKEHNVHVSYDPPRLSISERVANRVALAKSRKTNSRQSV
jgi:hypothetical protein